MTNKELLDQLMGKDRNKPTFKGLQEQWKDPGMCKPYILDFCPSGLFHNTKIDVGKCHNTHSDVVRDQYDRSSDPEKALLTRKYEMDLLTHLERVVDQVENRVRKQKERVYTAAPQFHLTGDRAREVEKLNAQISQLMKDAERLAEEAN